jgi:hypothetical protein
MGFENGVKNIPAAAYNGARTVYKNHIEVIQRYQGSKEKTSI